LISLFFHRLCSFKIPPVAARLLPGVFYFSLILFLLLPAYAGSAPNATRLRPEYFPQNSCFGYVAEESTASGQQREWSLPWVEKNDLQEHLLRRGETVDIFLCPEPEEWPISRVISLTEKPVLPVLKEIFLRHKFIRAGPAA